MINKKSVIILLITLFFIINNMTQETSKDIIVYTIIDDKYKVIGEFESIDLAFRFPPQDEIPTILPEETQIAFVLKNGWLKFNDELLKENQLVTRSPRFNIALDLIDGVNKESQVGRLDIIRCMLDSFVDGNAEGVAEKIQFIPETLEEFKQRVK